MELLQKTCTDGVDPRGPLCNQFQRDANGGKSEEHKKGSRWEKQEFRKCWAAQKFEDMTRVRGWEREDEWKQVDTTKGNMVSVKEPIKKEGAKDAKKYIENCAKLGCPWIQWDPMWERYEAMVMERSRADVFTKAWRRKCQRMEGPAMITAAPKAAQANRKGAKKTNAEGGETETPAKKQVTLPSPANKTESNLKSATSGRIYFDAGHHHEPGLAAGFQQAHAQAAAGGKVCLGPGNGCLPVRPDLLDNANG